MYKTLEELTNDYPDKKEREIRLRKMRNEEIDILIQHTRNIQGKNYLASFKKQEKGGTENGEIND